MNERVKTVLIYETSPELTDNPLKICSTDDSEIASLVGYAAVRELLSGVKFMEEADPVMGEIQRKEADGLRGILKVLGIIKCSYQKPVESLKG